MAITKKQKLRLERAIKALEAIISNTDQCTVFQDINGQKTETAPHIRVAGYLRSWVLFPLLELRDHKPNQRTQPEAIKGDPKCIQ